MCMIILQLNDLLVHSHMHVYMCACMGAHMHMFMGVQLHMCGGQRLTFGVILESHLPWFLRQGLVLTD